MSANDMAREVETPRLESPSDRTMRELRETPGTHPAPCWAPHSTDCTCDKGGAR